jgi:hypothetical protein
MPGIGTPGAQQAPIGRLRGATASAACAGRFVTYLRSQRALASTTKLPDAA